ncbi:MAG TPA: 2,3-bisphosphoglycerate-independent phosphoglycerate mutase [candidate division Zixibacteria bacterium]|nr:2,3-bisphosphoglycerate-independent phosphoglycerate mutase [candidate division Zixibacteria bacterium]
MFDEILPDLIQKNDTKAVFLVADGVGGTTVNGRTELDAAKTPNLDALASKSSLGLHYPVGYGLTPGSGPGHLGLFGYDPIKCQIGRGILEALGSGMTVRRGDLAVRGNFATIENGLITDRRAGRIPTEKCIELVAEIRENIADIDGIEFDIKAARDYRFAVVFHDASLKDGVDDADPQQTGLPPLPAKAKHPDSEKSAAIINRFIDEVTRVLADERPANTCLMRGAANSPDISPFEEKYGMSAQGIAVYPMYKGLAKLVGMEVPDGLQTLEEEIERLHATFADFDFHFLHFKYTDSAGEDGDFDRKVAMIEKFDAALPSILELEPDVVVITGDHSTPSSLKLHSWHPVPVLLHGKFAFEDDAKRFTERDAANFGILGHIPAQAIMMNILANCGRLAKFGA